MGKLRWGRNNELWFSETRKKCIRNSKLNLRKVWNGKTGKVYMLYQNRSFPSSAWRTNCPKSKRFSIECDKTKNRGNHKVYQKRGKYQKNLTLSPLRVTSIEFLLPISPLNHKSMSWEWRTGNDHQLKKLLIVGQILLVSTLVTVQRAVWRMWILMLGCKGLIRT